MKDIALVVNSLYSQIPKHAQSTPLHVISAVIQYQFDYTQTAAQQFQKRLIKPLIKRFESSLHLFLQSVTGTSWFSPIKDEHDTFDDMDYEATASELLYNTVRVVQSFPDVQVQGLSSKISIIVTSQADMSKILTYFQEPKFQEMVSKFTSFFPVNMVTAMGKIPVQPC